MKYIIGKNRSQLEMFCLDEHIAKDNEVRMIELFVDSLALADYGFVEREVECLYLCNNHNSDRTYKPFLPSNSF